MWNYFLVASGGALGSLARAWASNWMGARYGTGFPWGTLAVNVTGSFLIGVFAGIGLSGEKPGLTPGARSFLMAGICGGYTTFSAFSLQTLALAQQKTWLLASANILLNVGLCLAAVALGQWVGMALTSAWGSKAG